jgi:hypothetical protein
MAKRGRPSTKGPVVTRETYTLFGYDGARRAREKHAEAVRQAARDVRKTCLAYRAPRQKCEESWHVILISVWYSKPDPENKALTLGLPCEPKITTHQVPGRSESPCSIIATTSLCNSASPVSCISTVTPMPQSLGHSYHRDRSPGQKRRPDNCCATQVLRTPEIGKTAPYLGEAAALFALVEFKAVPVQTRQSLPRYS